MQQKVGPITELLEWEHEWIDARFRRFQEALAKGRIEAAPLEEAVEALHRHMYVEEDILFPAVEAHGLTGPTAVMAEEHGEICRLLGEIQGQVQAGAEPQEVLGTFRALHQVLGEHNVKEEQVLYPTSDRVLGQENPEQMTRRLREARAPEGWTCRAHRG